MAGSSLSQQIMEGNPMPALFRSHSVWMHAILAYAITWLIQRPELIVLRGDYLFSERFLLALILSSFGPSLAAIPVTAVTRGGSGVRGLLQRLLHWRVSWISKFS
jgi:hypothetical protein